MKRLVFLAFATVIATSATAAQSLAQLAWMQGSWTQNQNGTIVQESWLGPRGGMLAGVNLTSSPKGASFEFLRIVEKEGVISYLASPGGAAPTAFKLKELVGQRVVFENTANDFPQRILYWKDADGSLHARIEGSIGGKARAMDWRFTADAPAP